MTASNGVNLIWNEYQDIRDNEIRVSKEQSRVQKTKCPVKSLLQGTGWGGILTANADDTKADPD